MKKNIIWIIGVILTATAGCLALQMGIPSTQGNTSPTYTATRAAEDSPTDAGTAVPSYEGCSFIWANHDSPELTDKLNIAFRELEPNADANASLFGEDCVYADGHATFSTMETDFYVRLPVDDLSNEEVFGNWMAQVLTLIVAMPREDIPGNYGFVEFWFIRGDTEKLIVRVPIQEYLNQARGITGIKLYRRFLQPHVTPAPT
jgi:hypothetical protein